MSFRSLLYSKRVIAPVPEGYKVKLRWISTPSFTGLYRDNNYTISDYNGYSRSMSSKGVFLLKSNKGHNLPREALAWIGKVRKRALKIRQRLDKAGLESFERSISSQPNRGLVRFAEVNGKKVYEYDMQNAYLHVAQFLGYVNVALVRQAYRIRKKYDIKPAMLLGMALGGWVNECTITWDDVHRVYIKPILPPRRDFLVIAQVCANIMQNIAKETGAVAWWVDALLYDQPKSLRTLSFILQRKLGIPIVWCNWKVKEHDGYIVASASSVRIMLYSGGERKVWAFVLDKPPPADNILRYLTIPT